MAIGEGRTVDVGRISEASSAECHHTNHLMWWKVLRFFNLCELLKPVEVVVSHAKEPATEGGKVKSGMRTESLYKATKEPVHVPLSGKTMEFDRAAVELLVADRVM
ncbi:hypothetical protein [Denitromonas halophila]|uniref:Uncharacterized protein n=1 Tax=Denitromonas halophila TaxID=1629404 RepID=A0A557R0A4_9RHOO|nr:hypothetical protein [Denitromonas halophila]TVO58592.1 hypothetical protein FHP91_02695 [Denitromonas halophila]